MTDTPDRRLSPAALFPVTGNITRIDPAYGPIAGGVVIDIYGGPFPPPGPIQGWGFRFGAQAVPHTIVNSGHARITSLAWPAGHLQITNEDQQPGNLWGTANFQSVTPAAITGMTPTTGPVLGGHDVTIQGAGFTTTSRVMFGDQRATAVAIVNDNTLRVTTPRAREAGPVTVTVETLGGSPTFESYTYVGVPTVGVPVPLFRGRWRLTLHARAYAQNLHPLRDLFVTEIMDARTIRLEQALNQAAKLTFTLDGAAAAAYLLAELQTDVMAWRWDEFSGRDIPMFRGILAQSQDEISETADTVTFTCHDYASMLNRRLLTAPLNFAQADQDAIVAQLLSSAKEPHTSSGVSLSPGSYLPIAPLAVDPAGAQRGPSGVPRDRQYAAQQDIFEAVDNLAHVIGGFDYDVVPGLQYTDAWPDDQLRVFYPSQGVLRPDIVYEYGATLAALSRSVNSNDYANYQRTVGGTSNPDDPNAPPLFAEAWDDSANDVNVHRQGLWMSGDNASDVSIQTTLDQRAAGNLKVSGLFLPAYALTLAPEVYSWTNPRMGDVVGLVIRAGRLNVDTTEEEGGGIRVVGLTFVVGDSGQEDVTVQVGRADVKFGDLFTAAARDINALARR